MRILCNLKPSDVNVGDIVYYNPHMSTKDRVADVSSRMLDVSEQGEVTSWNPQYCFVRYGNRHGTNVQSKGTPWNKLFKIHNIEPKD